MQRAFTRTIVVAGMAIYPAAVFAQADEAEQMQNQQVAEQCTQDLNAFAEQMADDELWLTGWGTRWGYGADPAPVEPVADATPGAPMRPGAGPWSAAGTAGYGVNSPRYQIETLYSAAYVLAHKGDEEGCQYVLSELEDTYGTFKTRLQEAGVEPTDVTGWRQEQIALAEPVEEATGAGRLTVDELTGTDVRNLQDENLGSVSDVILNPDTGQVSYVIVARGGFLGIGEESVAVPWERLRATPGVNTLVVDISEESFEEAPTVDAENFGAPGQMAEHDRKVDDYWSGLDQN